MELKIQSSLTSSPNGERFLGNSIISTFNNTNSATNPKCQNGHTWTWGGNIGMDLEGVPCDCGMTLYHKEKCLCCSTVIAKEIPNKNYSSK